MSSHRLLVAGLLLVGVLAGCGGSGSRAGSGMMGGTSGMSGMMHTGSTTAGGGGGRALFVQYCGACHTLAAAGTSGTAGPNLDQAQPSHDVVVERVANGAGAMPAFADTLSRAQIRVIARYVSGAAR